jgi:hypothetical protein
LAGQHISKAMPTRAGEMDCVRARFSLCEQAASQVK